MHPFIIFFLCILTFVFPYSLGPAVAQQCLGLLLNFISHAISLHATKLQHDTPLLNFLVCCLITAIILRLAVHAIALAGDVFILCMQTKTVSPPQSAFYENAVQKFELMCTPLLHVLHLSQDMHAMTVSD